MSDTSKDCIWVSIEGAELGVPANPDEYRTFLRLTALNIETFERMNPGFGFSGFDLSKIEMPIKGPDGEVYISILTFKKQKE